MNSTSYNAVLMPAGVLLTGIGLVLTLPVLSYAVARRVAGSTRSLPLSLAHAAQ